MAIETSNPPVRIQMINGIKYFNRPPRVRFELPNDEIELPQPPPMPPQPPGLDLFLILMPIIASLATVVAYIAIGTQNSAFASEWPLLVPLTAMMLISPAASIYQARKQQRTYETHCRSLTRQYEERLQRAREQLHRLQARQEAILFNTHPETGEDPRQPRPDIPSLLSRVQTLQHLWERQPDDPDFLRLRIGIGRRESSVRIARLAGDPSSPLFHLAEKTRDEFACLPAAPITVDLRDIGSVGIAGNRSAATALIRAMLCQLMTHHAPDDVRIIAVYPPHRENDWHWLYFLPHVMHFRQDKIYDLLATQPDETERLMADVLEELSLRAIDPKRRSPYLILLIDDYERVRGELAVSQILRNGQQQGAAAICLVETIHDVPTSCGAIIEIPTAARMDYKILGSAASVYVGVQPDQASIPFSDYLTRLLASVRLLSAQGPQDLPDTVRLLSLIGEALSGEKLETPEALDFTQFWRNGPPAWRNGPASSELAVPLGLRSGGPLYIDLKNGAHGPHGVIAGTTGSGKSELLQTLITALALTHHPERVNFVLVDYKGGSSLNAFSRLPHTVGVVTNLNSRLAERALTALKSELRRRQKLLANAGELKDITTYQAIRTRAQSTGQALPPHLAEPLPHLFIVIDEFAELAKELPDFMNGLVSVVQVGRSLGVHLILAAQRPGGVVKADMWANLNFRICLRVASRDDSWEMLGRADAAHLPHDLPGRGYFKVGDIFHLFQTARVTTPARADTSGRARPGAASSPAATDNVTDLEIFLQRMEAARPPNLNLFKPWPDPLPERLSLSQLLAHDPHYQWPGLCWREHATEPEIIGASWTIGQPAWGWLRAPIGLLDLPAEQSQQTLILDLPANGGHLLIIGAPGSGKSMLLRTLILSLALSHSPADLHCYIIDLGGQLLSIFADLPHVGGVFHSTDTDRINRLIRKIRGMLEARKKLFQQAHASSFQEYNNQARQSNGQFTPLPAILLVIDNFGEFKKNITEGTADVAEVISFAREGRNYGLHLIATATLPGDIPPALLSIIELRLALRLTNTGDSVAVIGKSDAATLSATTPGRGLRRGLRPEEFQTALPAEGDSEEEQTRNLEEIVAHLHHAWDGQPRPQKIVSLPEYISLATLLPPTPPRPDTLTAILGREDLELEPVCVDMMNASPHYYVVGTVGSGKTTLLRTWLIALAMAYPKDRLRIAIVDFRRTLLPLHNLPQLWGDDTLGYAANEEQLKRLSAELKAEMEQRRKLFATAPASLHNPGSDTLPPWPELVVAIDDYEHLATGGGIPTNSLAQDLSPFLRAGRDLGLHIILATGSQDLGLDPLVKGIESWRTGIILSADPQKLVMGIRPADFPPGRGYLVQRSNKQLIQIAVAENELLERILYHPQHISSNHPPAPAALEHDQHTERGSTANHPSG